MIKLLNPFSVSLQKPNPYMEVNSEPVYKYGDYLIYKYAERHYLHTWKNLIIGERCAANKELIQNLDNLAKPKNKTREYFDYTRCLEALQEAKQAAQKLNFQIQ